jgi:hypothetical protein
VWAFSLGFVFPEAPLVVGQGTPREFGRWMLLWTRGFHAAAQYALGMNPSRQDIQTMHMTAQERAPFDRMIG